MEEIIQQKKIIFRFTAFPAIVLMKMELYDLMETPKKMGDPSGDVISRDVISGDDIREVDILK